jgi:hypothetical protein
MAPAEVAAAAGEEAGVNRQEKRAARAAAMYREGGGE